MKKKPKIVYSPIEGSAPLSIYWTEVPYGDAKESKEGNGVYWTSSDGALLGVQFDDVLEKKDSQKLTLTKNRVVHINVAKGNISVEVLGDTQAA